ncbi:MAG: hypothetical protein L0Y64_20590 [Myxococcaceae bacterium]|nr:hypothetical protein [Myxococcaceae bacterium]
MHALVQQRRVIRARDVASVGLIRSVLGLGEFWGTAVRVERGLYVAPDVVLTPAQVAALRVPRGVLCMLSALHIHGLLPRRPRAVWLAVAAKAWAPRLRELDLELVRVKPERWERDVEERILQDTVLRVDSLVRALVDCFVLRHRLPPGTGASLLRVALARGLCSTNALEEMARRDRVMRQIGPILEEERSPMEIPTSAEALLEPLPPPPPAVPAGRHKSRISPRLAEERKNLAHAALLDPPEQKAVLSLPRSGR